MSLRRRQKQNESQDGPKLAAPTLPCHGCAHSAASVEFPGCPSGERPCCFCVRNPNGIHPEALHPDPGYVPPADDARAQRHHERKRGAGPDEGLWYDGTPAYKTPMDNYIATDRIQQQRIFDELNRLERDGKEAPPREKYPSLHDPEGEAAWCCEGGAGPGGHTWTCWRWLGISFG